MVFYSFFDHSTIIYKHSHTITIPISTKKSRMRRPTFPSTVYFFLLHIFLQLKGLNSDSQKQRSHELLWMLWFDEKLYVYLMNILLHYCCILYKCEHLTCITRRSIHKWAFHSGPKRPKQFNKELFHKCNLITSQTLIQWSFILVSTYFV